MVQIPKPVESWVVKVETDRESANKDLRRAKGLKAMPRRALVVENEPAMCALIQEVLESAEIEAVTPAKSGENERHFHEEKFDVILIGLCASTVDGVELVRKIRRSGMNRLTPIIMISDDQRPRALSQGFDAGASFFVYKPIDRAHLTRLILVTQGTIEHERRRFRRVPLRVKVRIKSDKDELVGETIDVSLNGARGRTPTASQPRADALEEDPAPKSHNCITDAWTACGMCDLAPILRLGLFRTLLFGLIQNFGQATRACSEGSGGAPRIAWLN